MVQMLLGLLLRHGITFLAALLVSKGVTDGSGAEAISGGLTTAAAIGLSYLNKVKVVDKINKAAATGDDFSKLNK